MKLDRAGIAQRVPHAGRMCLLEEVAQWDAQQIICVAAAPDGAHPLARNSAVPALAAIEYAAQATAVHGALREGRAAPRDGMLSTLSDIDLQSACIPCDDGPLTVRACMVSGGASSCLYDFEVETARQPIARGRLMVVYTP